MKMFLFSQSDVHTCSRIKCQWSFSEFLCGDKCLSNRNTCYCGNGKFNYEDANYLYCCQEPNTTCIETNNGDIYCQGQILLLHEICHGSCTQTANGLTMLPCADQNECYIGISACKGTPQCKE